MGVRLGSTSSDGSFSNSRMAGTTTKLTHCHKDCSGPMRCLLRLWRHQHRFTWPADCRRKMNNWCRSAAFSASSRLFDLHGEAKTAKTKQNSSNIVH